MMRTINHHVPKWSPDHFRENRIAEFERGKLLEAKCLN